MPPPVVLEGAPAATPWIDHDVISPTFGESYRGKSPPEGYLTESRHRMWNPYHPPPRG